MIYEQIWSRNWHPLPRSSNQNNKDISSKQRKTHQKTYQDHTFSSMRIGIPWLALRCQRRQLSKLVDVHRWGILASKVASIQVIRCLWLSSEVLISESALFFCSLCLKSRLDFCFSQWLCIDEGRWTTEAEVATRVSDIRPIPFRASHWGY